MTVYRLGDTNFLPSEEDNQKKQFGQLAGRYVTIEKSQVEKGGSWTATFTKVALITGAFLGTAYMSYRIGFDAGAKGVLNAIKEHYAGPKGVLNAIKKHAEQVNSKTIGYLNDGAAKLAQIGSVESINWDKQWWDSLQEYFTKKAYNSDPLMQVDIKNIINNLKEICSMPLNILEGRLSETYTAFKREFLFWTGAWTTAAVSILWSVAKVFRAWHGI